MNNSKTFSFKEWFFNESKAIVFPPEIQQKLHEIANKMLPILIELAKKEQGKDDFYEFVDKIEFNDPYQNKKRTYDVYAARTKNKYAGWQQAHSERPNIVVTTNIAFPELEKNQQWLDSLKKGTSHEIIYKFVYNNKEKVLEDIYNTLSHELAHAYDPTISKGYRDKTGSPEEYVKKRKAAEEYKRKKGQIGTFLDRTGIGKLFGRKNPEEEFQQHLKDSEKTKLAPYFYDHEHDGTEEGKKQAYKKYYEQEPEFVAQMSGWANYVLNYARQSIKNDDPSTMVIKQITVFKDLINYIREGKSHREKFNPLIQASGFKSIKYYMTVFKKKKPSMYRKLLEKISNVALEAYNIITNHIKDNNIESQVTPEIRNWLIQNIPNQYR
jgi:hypothetical protein